MNTGPPSFCPHWSQVTHALLGGITKIYMAKDDSSYIWLWVFVYEICRQQKGDWVKAIKILLLGKVSEINIMIQNCSNFLPQHFPMKIHLALWIVSCGTEGTWGKDEQIPALISPADSGESSLPSSLILPCSKKYSEETNTCARHHILF